MGFVYLQTHIAMCIIHITVFYGIADSVAYKFVRYDFGTPDLIPAVKGTHQGVKLNLYSPRTYLSFEGYGIKQGNQADWNNRGDQ